MYLRSIWSSENTKIKIYRTIVVPVVLYGCETWLLTLGEKRRLRVLENRVLRGIFGPKRDEETGACSTYRERRGVYRVLVGKPEKMRTPGRSRRRWEDNIKMDILGNVMWGHGLDQAGSGSGQVVSTCKCGNELSGSTKFGEILD
jgi:hypothetical protein